MNFALQNVGLVTPNPDPAAGGKWQGFRYPWGVLQMYINRPYHINANEFLSASGEMAMSRTTYQVPLVHATDSVTVTISLQSQYVQQLGLWEQEWNSLIIFHKIQLLLALQLTIYGLY